MRTFIIEAPVDCLSLFFIKNIAAISPNLAGKTIKETIKIAVISKQLMKEGLFGVKSLKRKAVKKPSNNNTKIEKINIVQEIELYAFFNNS